MTQLDYESPDTAAAKRWHVGTLAYTLGEDWSLVDGFYFAVATLTTSSIADPELVITNSWLKRDSLASP